MNKITKLLKEDQMDESIETKVQKFGRWRNMTEWYEEAEAITEKSQDPGCTENIPVPGKWELNIYIPGRGSSNTYSFYEPAMETAMALLVDMGARPKDAYLERGFCVVELQPAEFYVVSHLVEEIRGWLLNKGIKTSVGNRFCEEYRKGPSAYLEFRQSLDAEPSPGYWSLEVMMPQDEGTQLGTDLELAAKEGGRCVGGYLFYFAVDDFNIGKAKAIRAIAWLSRRGYEVQTSWGKIDQPLETVNEETLRALNETGEMFYKWDFQFNNVKDFRPASVRFEDRNQIYGEYEHSRKLKRLRSRLASSTEESTITKRLTHAQVRVLVDLTGELLTQCSTFTMAAEGARSGYHISDREWDLHDDANEIEDHLMKILEELR
jgi:hypothetical protein